MNPMTWNEWQEEEDARISTEKRPLWCVAAEEWNPKKNQWRAVLRYNHAHDQSQARASYVLARKVPFRIIDVARVVGYHVQDKKGELLSV